MMMGECGGGGEGGGGRGRGMGDFLVVGEEECSGFLLGEDGREGLVMIRIVVGLKIMMEVLVRGWFWW